MIFCRLVSMMFLIKTKDLFAIPQFVQEFSSLAYKSENVARKVKTDSWNIQYAYLARKSLDDSIISKLLSVSHYQ